MLESFVNDLRYGLRMVRKSPSFVSIIVLTLGLGIGANTAIFSLVNAVLMRQLPVHSPDELVVIGDPVSVHLRITNGPPRTDVFSYQLYKDLRHNSNAFSGMLGSSEVQRVRVAHPGAPSGNYISDQTLGCLVTGNYFSVLGIYPYMGRFFGEDLDDVPDAHPVAVISYGFWAEKLSHDPEVIGRQLLFNNYPFTVIGVAQPDFFGDTVGDKQDVWFPVSMQAELIPGVKWLAGYQNSWLHILARRKPEVSVTQAHSNVNVVFQQLVNGPMGSVSQLSSRETLRRLDIKVAAGGRGFSQLRGRYQQPLWLLMGIVGLVLLIACVNVANLLLARALSRRKEVAVRLALGAPSRRLVTQLLTESILLAFMGGILGLAVAQVGIRLLLQMTQAVNTTVAIDSHVLLFTAMLCLLTGVLFGLVPALRAVDVSLLAALKSGTDQSGALTKNPARWNWGKLFVVAQIALSVWVLFTAGLLVRSLRNLRNVDMGMTPENIVMIRINQIAAGYRTAQQRAQFSQQVAERFSHLPGVQSVSYSQNGLFFGVDSLDSIRIDGFVPRTNDDANSPTDRVGPKYFSTLHIPVLRGREIDFQDSEFATRIAVVNQAWARFYFGGDDPIGKKISIIDVDKVDTYQIVGVVGNARDQALRADAPRRFYVPIAQSPDSQGIMNFLVRVSGNPESLFGTLRKTAGSFEPNAPVIDVRLLPIRIEESIQSDVTVSRISGFFATVALLLVCIGLYGVMAYTVARTTKTIGLRMALGAQKRRVLWMVLQDALKVVAAGIIFGVPVALLSSNILSSLLYGLKATDPASLFAVIVILGIVALSSSYIPARRATRVDPWVALREE